MGEEWIKEVIERWWGGEDVNKSRATSTYQMERTSSTNKWILTTRVSHQLGQISLPFHYYSSHFSSFPSFTTTSHLYPLFSLTILIPLSLSLRTIMGRSPCCEKQHTNKGAWTKEEDQRLINYIKTNGEGCWRSLPKAAGIYYMVFLRSLSIYYILRVSLRTCMTGYGYCIGFKICHYR